MGICSRYTAAFLIILSTIASPSATAATLHPVPSIAKALAAGPTGVMPSGLTVLRSQQLGTMLLKSQVQLAINGSTLAVTRGASLSVGALGRAAVTILKNSSPPKIIAGAVITAAVASIPGAKVHEGQLIRAGESDPFTGPPGTDQSWCVSGSTVCAYTAREACSIFAPMGRYDYSQKYGMYISITGYRLENKGTHYTDCHLQGSGYGDFATHTLVRTGTECPGGTYSEEKRVCVRPGSPVPFTTADFDALEAAIPASNPDPADVTDFWFNLCGGDGTCMGSYTSSPTLAGPVSLPSMQTTTTSTGPAGTTTTTKTTQTDLDYSNPDGVVSRDKTTTTTTNPDGSQSTDITEDTGPVVGAEPKDELEGGTFNDSPLPEIAPFYDPIYKVGFGGLWDQRMGEITDSAFIDFMHSFIPTFSGSCPAFSLNFDIASWASFGTFDFWDLCWIFDFVKVCILVTAAFLCRALIFGG